MSRAHVRLLKKVRKLLVQRQQDRICLAISRVEGVPSWEHEELSNTAWEVKRHIALYIAGAAVREGYWDSPLLLSHILAERGRPCQFALAGERDSLFVGILRNHGGDEIAARVEFIDTILIPYWETHEGNGRPINHRKEKSHG